MADVTSMSSDAEKENFLVWVEWLPVISGSHVTSQAHGQTNGMLRIMNVKKSTIIIKREN